MTSDKLNEKIRAICDDATLYEAFGGKSIPYIGWYWRDVNFDAETYVFGILPILEGLLDRNNKIRLGFMENNKWDYDYLHCPTETWKEIKMLLEFAVRSPSYKSLKTVDDKIQSLLNNS